MRLLEWLLIAANLVALFLLLGKASRRTRSWAVAVNVSVLILHALVEGIRYQLAFSYLLVLLLAVHLAVVKHVRLQRTTLSKALRGFAYGVALLLLAFTVLLAYALPVFQLPRPSGSYAVGVQSFHLVDEQRQDPFLDKTPKKRELMVKLYYPAALENGGRSLRYFDGNAGLIRAFTGFYQGFPSFLFEHLRLVKTNAQPNSPIASQETSYPVVLYSHGAGTSMEVETSPCEDLASRGYIVAAIDHTYVSAATAFPDRIVSQKEATTDFQAVESAGIISEIMAEDARFVVGKLEELNTGSMDARFKNKLDLDRLGAAGHSIGGAAAYNLALTDKRVKAAVNVDGFVYRTPPKDADTLAPLLMLANDRYHVQLFEKRRAWMEKFEDLPELDQQINLEIYGSREAYDEEYRKANENLLGLADAVKKSGALYTIQGSDHMKFTDIGLYFGLQPLRERIGIGGETEPVRCLRITEDLTAAFMDRHLKGKSEASLEKLSETYPELKKVTLP
ncbi:hypothetical protein N6H14_27970 [Paenibacillus sp. CC-CFT747]|nr:hypothetical protein N6H14_27970 [Paenibacillus sp. CC-CFT747]